MKPKTIAIIGLGLMGGSLAAACRKKFPKSRIVGISRDAAALRLALRKRWVHEGTSNLKTGIREAGLIILCTPVDVLKNMLRKIESAAKPGTLVTDVGSTKGEISRWVERQKFRKIQFVGAHPMMGSHERGITAARPDLYDHGITFVVRSRKTPAASFSEIKNFWSRINPSVVITSPEEHDKITSEISHLPHLAAVCLVLAAGNKAMRYAGPGFLDATRIAQGHPTVWLPIFRANRRAVLKALAAFEAQCGKFRKTLQGKGAGLEKMLSQARKRRGQISL